MASRLVDVSVVALYILQVDALTEDAQLASRDIGLHGDET